MMNERRKTERVQVKLDARWENIRAQRDGTIVDISASGCFILTIDEVKCGELIGIEIQIPTGRWIYLWAEVIYTIPEMGFALRFTGSIDETEQCMLDILINYVSETKISVEA
ncbi:MAG TPA: PilZ domain-containing protein [Pyrinomonadaceae bacterium]|jgi:hypothetical protein|nr:PilZ domain-containing protein [Pyrinomonadaceae bacterium]